MIVLVRGTNESSNYSYRITAALASASVLRYKKKVAVIQTTQKHPVDDLMVGKTIVRNNHDEFTFEDTGLDALMRRIEMGPLTGEKFADCTRILTDESNINGFNIAGISKLDNVAQNLINHFAIFTELLKNADRIYDVVYVYADANDKELIEKIESLKDEITLKEVVCIAQGPKEDFEANAPEILFAVKNYDADSSFNTHMMQRLYNSKKLYPVPYNIGFKDACLNQIAASYFSTNVTPEESDDNNFFIRSIVNMAGIVLNEEETEHKERMFVYALKKEQKPDVALEDM